MHLAVCTRLHDCKSHKTHASYTFDGSGWYTERLATPSPLARYMLTTEMATISPLVFFTFFKRFIKYQNFDFA